MYTPQGGVNRPFLNGSLFITGVPDRALFRKVLKTSLSSDKKSISKADQHTENSFSALKLFNKVGKSGSEW